MPPPRHDRTRSGHYWQSICEHTVITSILMDFRLLTISKVCPKLDKNSDSSGPRRSTHIDSASCDSKAANPLPAATNSFPKWQYWPQRSTSNCRWYLRSSTVLSYYKWLLKQRWKWFSDHCFYFLAEWRGIGFIFKHKRFLKQISVIWNIGGFECTLASFKCKIILVNCIWARIGRFICYISPSSAIM